MSMKQNSSTFSLNRMEKGTLSSSSSMFNFTTAKRLPYVYLFFTAFFLIGGLILGGQLEGGQFAQDQQNDMTPTAVAGNAIVFAALILGAYSYGLALIHIAQAYHAGYLSKSVTVSLISSLITGCAIGIGLCIQYWVQYGLTWEQQTVEVWPDYLQQLFAALIIPTFLLLSMASMVTLVSIVMANYTGPASWNGGKLWNIFYAVWSSRILQVLVTLLVLGTFFFATMFMNPIWYTGYADYVSGPAANPINLPDGSTAFEGLITPIIYPVGDQTNVPENYFPQRVVINLYLDAVVYFSVLVGILLLGFLSSFIPTIRSKLHHRVNVSFIPGEINTFRYGATVGELIVTASITGLFSFWLWYWSTSNYRVSLDLNGTGTRWPRTMGHLTTLAMSLLTFPVARNGPLTAAFGIPYERAVKFHRLLGRICWSAVTIHMILWQVKWLKDGNLWMNVFTLTNLTLDPSPVTHPNNFTVPLAEFAWLLLTIALIIAGVLRRRSYETFQYTHIVVLFFFLVGLVHAWGHWYYTAGGLLLWAWDKTLRLINSASKVEIISISHAAGITKLEVLASAFSRKFKPGQYAFICIPVLDSLQWHPFSISKRIDNHMNDGHNSDDIFVFHIMNHGPKTWTGKLTELSLSHSLHDSKDAISVSMDAPYGNLGDYHQQDTVILVAGGIGITPLASVLIDMVNRIEKGEEENIPRNVHLIWSVRDSRIITIYADLLAHINKTYKDRFTLHLHTTEQSSLNKQKNVSETTEEYEGATETLLESNKEEHDGFEISPLQAGWCNPTAVDTVLKSVKQGRPNVQNIITDIISDNDVDTKKVSVFVCGPEPLINEVSKVAFTNSINFHSEVFHW